MAHSAVPSGARKESVLMEPGVHGDLFLLLAMADAAHCPGSVEPIDGLCRSYL